MGTGQYHVHIDLDSDTGGGARFDLIYAKVTVDQASGVSRKVKDPATLVVSTQTVDSRVNTTVEVLELKGTEGAATKPTLPSDAGNVYYFGLAYVRVPAGFVSGATAITGPDVWEWVECAAMGMADACRPAGGNNSPSGAVETRTPWTIAGVRPAAHLPSTMTGKEELLIAIDLASTPKSHNDGDILDQSRDWRGRIFKWSAYARSTSARFPWEGTAGNLVPKANVNWGTYYGSGMGQSIDIDGVVAGDWAIFRDDGTLLTDNAGTITISVDSVGRLILNYTGTPGVKLFIWIEASAQYANRV
jgi:hypothetical protein